MGYETTFEGRFTFDRPLAPEHRAYLAKFAYIRHMLWDENLLADHDDPLREAVGLPVGPYGMYFTGSEAFHGQEDYSHPALLKESPRYDGSEPEEGEPRFPLPSLWCEWVPTRDGTGLEWSGQEKFYRYVKWLEFLIGHFLAPWGYVLGGTVTYAGADEDDRGSITVVDNKVIVQMEKPGYEKERLL